MGGTTACEMGVVTLFFWGNAGYMDMVGSAIRLGQHELRQLAI